MNKKMLPIIFLLTTIFISACGNGTSNNEALPIASQSSSQSASEPALSPSPSESSPETGTKTYQSELGPIEVPANPQRIVTLTNTENVLALGGTIVGVDDWTITNPLFTEKLAGAEVVTVDDLGKIVELEPDLIIADTSSNNIDKLQEIAPTVAYTWGKLDYLSQLLEIGKLLNKEQDAQAWIDDFKKRAETLGQEIKAKIGENATVSVIETDSKEFYVFGNNWARGTELLYQAMGLNMPEKVKTDALGPGYYSLSPEVLSDYIGDYLVLSRSSEGDNSFMQTDTWKKIPAVKNNHVIEIVTEKTTYSDPLTLDYLMNVFKEGFLK
ncbi:iron-hydroxamate ABC transporter substrate-binding protein [Cohnella lupini]|uniref:Iron complex transport system substrate-binding protein n=1 Tax=Cohnella lupini TaxID=1294267 RepID=A0A3D9IZ63_9BACL|nr:iron-hydroxamate ABC transporter substrate-binding protein [Cohnella lupini]RED66356.1 iron complex transport system substrate-binding protein [Cohnella lupini]